MDGGNESGLCHILFEKNVSPMLFKQCVCNLHSDGKQEGGTLTLISKLSARDGYEYLATVWIWPLKFLTLLSRGDGLCSSLWMSE